jgi:3-hydroxy acid dehydrogenase / malonic semialdehyde reductase
MSSRLAGRWVLITGASSGIGAAAARAFAVEGARLLLGARRTDRIEALATECRTLGAAEARAHALDVASTESVKTFVAWAGQLTSTSADKDNGAVRILINNAGGAVGVDPVATALDADWETMVQSNLIGLLRMTRETLPLMQRPGGYILNIGSIAGRVAYPGGAAYCAVKAGTFQITKALRHELMGTGIRVGSLDPGLVETEFAIVRYKGDAEQANAVYAGMTPLTGEDIAETLVFMATRPDHVCLDEILILPTDQVTVGKVHRRA